MNKYLKMLAKSWIVEMVSWGSRQLIFGVITQKLHNNLSA